MRLVVLRAYSWGPVCGAEEWTGVDYMQGDFNWPEVKRMTYEIPDFTSSSFTSITGFLFIF